MPSDTPSAAVEAAAPELSEKKTEYGLVDDADTHASDRSSSEGVTAVRDPILDEFDEAAERRILRKVDWHLIPACGLLYFVCAIDRINLGAAQISGMKEELQLGVGYRYSLITLVYFFTYVIFQAPATLAVRFLRPQLMLPTLACAWTALMLGASFTTEWTQMIAVRMLLGICEAALYPAVVYLLSTWYLREEMAKRYGYWLLIARMASTIGPFFQYGFIKMDGVGGRRGW